MKTTDRLRALLLKNMRFYPDAAASAAYGVMLGSRRYFGADTRELLDRVVKIAQREERRAKR